MPSKNKRIPEKEAIWQCLCDVDHENLEQIHVEYVYKLNSVLSHSQPGSNSKDVPVESQVQNDGNFDTVHAKNEPQSSTHCQTRCRKNCSSDPYCLASLGFERWTAGDMDYDFPSDDEEDDCLVSRKKGIPVGLVNLGATCYVNAFLQLWYHNLAFRNAVFEWRPEREEGFTICDALQYIFGLLKLSKRSCVDPSSLIEILGLDASQQQDAQEFSKLFIDLLPCPQVKNMFAGSYDYVTRCSTCKHESRTSSEFSELDLSIEGLTTLDECMKSFLQVEKLVGDNQYFCSKCQCKQNATRRIQLKKLPPVLNIQLLRFVFDRKTGHKKKLNTCLQFPDQLDLTSLVSANGEQHQYELTAALMHSGVTAFSGHYTAHIHIQEHWYSFNDANVIKLKGKKLNLSNEESLDFNPGVTLTSDTQAAPSDTRKRGNRSKNAYMLVYQKKTFIQATKDLQPSPVPDNIEARVTEDNEKLLTGSDDAEMRQTEQMMRVDMKKEQLAGLSEGLQATSGTTENYHFLPLSWLTDSLKDWGDIKPINTTALLCHHGKLNWNLSSRFKVVSEAKGKEVYDAHSDEDTVILTRRDSLCYECIKNQLIWRKCKERTEEDNNRISNLLATTSSPSDRGCVQHWLSKSELRRWRSLAHKPLELAAQPTAKSNKSSANDTEESKLVQESSADGQSFNIPVTDGTRPDTPSQNGSADSSVNGDGVNSVDEDYDERFNADIKCEHGNLDSLDKHRQLVPQSVWDIFIGYFPDAVAFTDEEPVCKECLGMQEEMGVIEEQRKAIVKEERLILSDLSALRNRPILDQLTTDTVYCMTMSSYKHWKLFLRNPTTSSGIESIVNSSVVCPHGMLCVHPADDNSVVLLWPYEWDVISKHFPCDQIIEVKSRKSNEPAVTPYFTIPDICSECTQSRLLSEELESHNFNNSTVYIRLLDDEKSNSAIHSANQSLAEDSFTTTDDELQPDPKKLKTEPLQSDSSAPPTPLAQRRSGRRKRVRGDKHIRISSDLSLKDLRVEVVKLFAIAPFDQVLTLDGRKLEGDDKSLAQLKLYPDCLLLLKGSVYDENKMEQALVEQGLLEEGFRGTGLIANCSNR